ncbi:MAG TPA: CaiB/BaiF CoA-transferase family protein [Gaiellaceae bacterium]|nr:CaiB/BaiF CoA-transferase family protein [Gaiellaceae bacterium]
MQALGGSLVVDLTRHLPGAFASRELLRLGARVVRVEPPGGTLMRTTTPEWHERLNAGKESVVCDLPAEAAFARSLLARADVVLEAFRPGVAEQLGVGPQHAPASAVYCSITGFGVGNRHEARVGHDLNYMGWAGVLDATGTALPPVQAADLAGGALVAVNRILAALLVRAATGDGSRIVVSITHGAHELASRAPALTQNLACYSIYETADGRRLTVGALEPKFFARLCTLLERPDWIARQYGDGQPALREELAATFRRRPLADWLRLFEDEDVCVGPVATLAEAEADFGSPATSRSASLGEHTEAWREAVRA